MSNVTKTRNRPKKETVTVPADYFEQLVATKKKYEEIQLSEELSAEAAQTKRLHKSGKLKLSRVQKIPEFGKV